VTGMVKKKTSNTTKGLSRSILDAGFYEVRRQLTYKAEDRGRRVIVIDRFFASSKRCSHCGETRAKLALRERVFECSTCGISLERDVNAARNIHREGLRLLTTQASTVAGHQPETINAVSRDRETEPPRWGRGHRYQSRTTQQLGELTLSA
jgi:transposase